MKRMVSWLLMLCLLCVSVPAYMDEAPAEPVIQEESPEPIVNEPEVLTEDVVEPSAEGSEPTEPGPEEIPEEETPEEELPEEENHEGETPETPESVPQDPLFWPEELAEQLEEEEVLLLAVGDELELPLGVREDIVAQNPEILWESDDEALATVDEDGVVTGIAAGDVEIKASLKDDVSVFVTYPVQVFGELEEEGEPTLEPSEEPVEGEPIPEPTEEPETDSIAPNFDALEGVPVQASDVFQLPDDGTYYAYMDNISQLIPFLTEEYVQYADSLSLVSGDESILRVEGADKVYGVAAGSCQLLVRLSESFYSILPVQVIEAPIVDGISLLDAVLPKPEDIAWSDNYAFATWSSVLDADGYYVELFRDSASVKRWLVYETSIIPGTRRELLGNLMTTAGTYYFTVTAMEYGGTASTNVATSKNYTYTIPSGTVQLDPPENLTWSKDTNGDVTLNFNNPRNYYLNTDFADAFPVRIYRDGELVYESSSLARGATLKSLNIEGGVRQGDYTFSMQTISADHARYTNSAWVTSVVEEIRNTNDALLWSYIERVYYFAFQRTPDTMADTWFNGLKKGSMSGAEVAHGCFLSLEYLLRNKSDEQFVTEIYQVCFNRVPAASEVAWWQDYLTKGATRASVLNAMIDYTEFTIVCAQYGIKKGIIPDLENIDKDPRLTLFVKRMYEKIFNRLGFREEVDRWCGQILSNQIYGNDVVASFVFGQECIDRKLNNTQFVEMMFEAMLDRAPDTDDMRHWLNEMAKVEANKGDSRRALYNELIKTTEYINVMAYYGVERVKP